MMKLSLENLRQLNPNYNYAPEGFDHAVNLKDAHEVSELIKSHQKKELVFDGHIQDATFFAVVIFDSQYSLIFSNFGRLVYVNESHYSDADLDKINMALEERNFTYVSSDIFGSKPIKDKEVEGIYMSLFDYL